MDTTEMRICKKCGMGFCATPDFFYRNKSRIDGLNETCKQCNNQRHRDYVNKNRDKIRAYNNTIRKINPERYSTYSKNNYERHKDLLKLRSKEYHIKNRDRILARDKKKREGLDRSVSRERRKRYIENNRDKVNKSCREYHQRKRRKDLQFRIKELIRTRIKKSMNGIKKYPSIKYLGCSADEYKAYLEGLFTDGMNWSNMGRKGWHIDHIIPVSLFDMSIEAEAMAAFNFKNTQPMWWDDNLHKGTKINPGFIMKQKLIYMAGALNASECTAYVQNLHRMLVWSKKIRDEGFAVFTPGNDMLEGVVDGGYSYEDYFSNSQVILSRCDGIFLVPGWEQSKGTAREIVLAKSLEIPVFRSIEELHKHFEK